MLKHFSARRFGPRSFEAGARLQSSEVFPILLVNSMKNAFTLIELLVVIAIIAILAAILFPVFAQAKRAAKDSAGISNVKQNGTALNMYASDFDDMVMIHETDWHQNYTPWPILAYPYIKNTDIDFDPAKQKSVTVSPSSTWGSSTDANSWGYQVHMAINRYGLANRSLTSISGPAERVAFAYGELQLIASPNNVSQFSQHWFDGQRSACPAVAVTPTDYWTDEYNQISRAAIKYHADGIIASFADSHAKKVNYKQATKPQTSFAGSAQCEKDNFYGPDGQYGTADDLDTPLTRMWGRWWDGSY